MSKEKRVDIFHLFRRMGDSDYDWVLTMSDEDLKTVSVYVLLMWIHGADRDKAAHLILTNQYVNNYVFSLSKHNRLLLLLLFATNGDMDHARYSFTKSVGKNETKMISAIAHYYNCTYDNAKDYADILSKEEIDEILKVYEDYVK